MFKAYPGVKASGLIALNGTPIEVRPSLTARGVQSLVFSEPTQTRSPVLEGSGSILPRSLRGCTCSAQRVNISSFAQSVCQSVSRSGTNTHTYSEEEEQTETETERER
eukprot:58671-Pleurochrysis_carterae.AAC.4